MSPAAQAERAPFKVVNADDNPQGENANVQGSSNLSDVLKEHKVIRGTFFLNGTEFRDFEARSPGDVARRINEKSRATGVEAWIDDGFRLNLEGDGPGDIAIASGRHDDDHRAALAIEGRNAAQTATPIEQELRRANDLKADERRKDQPDVLELLGLEETAELNAERGGADWSPGPSKEDRAKARAEGRLPERQRRSILGGANAAEDAAIAERQGRTGGGTTTLNQGPSDVESHDPHRPADYPEPRGTQNERGQSSNAGSGKSPPVGSEQSKRPGYTPPEK